MPPLFNEQQLIRLDVQKSVAITSPKGLIQQIPCVFIFPKEDAIGYFDLAPFHDVLEAAEGYGLKKAKIHGGLPDHACGPYTMRIWDHHKKANEQELALKAEPFVLEHITIGTITISQHKKEDGALMVATTLSLPINSSELAGEINKCAGKSLMVTMERVQLETDEKEEEPEEGGGTTNPTAGR